jgi:hypothetical protein
MSGSAAREAAVNGDDWEEAEKVSVDCDAIAIRKSTFNHNF